MRKHSIIRMYLTNGEVLATAPMPDHKAREHGIGRWCEACGEFHVDPDICRMHDVYIEGAEPCEKVLWFNPVVSEVMYVTMSDADCGCEKRCEPRDGITINPVPSITVGDTGQQTGPQTCTSSAKASAKKAGNSDRDEELAAMARECARFIEKAKELQRAMEKRI